MLGLHMILESCYPSFTLRQATVSALISSSTKLLYLGIDQLSLVIWKGLLRLVWLTGCIRK
jgi:hypothetical protein